VVGSTFITVYEIILIDALWFVRNVVIGIKYAYTSEIELREMRRVILSPETQNERMILSGWIAISHSGVERQIKVSLFPPLCY